MYSLGGRRWCRRLHVQVQEEEEEQEQEQEKENKEELGESVDEDEEDEEEEEQEKENKELGESVDEEEQEQEKENKEESGESKLKDEEVEQEKKKGKEEKEPQEESVQANTSASGLVQGASTGSWKKRVGDLRESCSWWLSKNVRRRRRVATNGGGVEVVPAAAKGIGKLTQLHTLGVVNISGGKGGLLLLKELKKLTQLRKLGLSGINHKNWKDLCLAVLGHLPHLESLSLLLLLEEDGSYDFACFDDISRPPKTLKSLKVFYTSTGGGAGAGAASIRPAWINQFPNLKRFNHEVRISSQDDIDSIEHCEWDSKYRYGETQISEFERGLAIKPTQQHLSFEEPPTLALNTLRIYCSSISSTVTFGEYIVIVKALSIHCCSSCGGSSCLQIVGLQHIERLEQVLVMGPCSDSFKKDLRRQLKKHEGKPVLKLL